MNVEYNIMVVRLLVSSNCIHIFNKIRWNFSMTRYRNPNGNSTSVEWLLYNNIRMAKSKESICLSTDITLQMKIFVRKQYVSQYHHTPNSTQVRRNFVLPVCLHSSVVVQFIFTFTHASAYVHVHMRLICGECTT